MRGSVGVCVTAYQRGEAVIKKAAPPKESGCMINLYFSLTASLRWYYPGQVMRVIQMILDSQPEAPPSYTVLDATPGYFPLSISVRRRAPHDRLPKRASYDDNAEAVELSGRDEAREKAFSDSKHLIRLEG